MKTIEKLKSIPVTDEQLFRKINEIIDVLNGLPKDVYIGKSPNAYDLNAVHKILKSKKP
jgi:hypothetical protein